MDLKELSPFCRKLTSAQYSVAAGHNTRLFIHTGDEHQYIEPSGNQTGLCAAIWLVTCVPIHCLYLIVAARIVVVDRRNLAHEVIGIEQLRQPLSVDFKICAVGKIKAILTANGLWKVLGHFRKLLQGKAHSIEHFLTLCFVRAVDAELQTGLAIVEVVLDVNPFKQTLLEVRQLGRKAGGKNRVNHLDADTSAVLDFSLILIEPASEVKNCLIEDWLAHSGKVQIKTFCVSHTGKQPKSAIELRLVVFKTCIASPRYLWYIAERTVHDAAILGTDSDDPLLTQRHAVRIRHTVDWVCESQEVCLDIVRLAIVANAERFKLTLAVRIGEKITCVKWVSLHIALCTVSLNYSKYIGLLH